MDIVLIIFTFYLLFCLLKFFIKAIPVILVFPVLPFLLYSDEEWRKEYPISSKIVVVLWGVLYAIILLISLVFLIV